MKVKKVAKSETGNHGSSSAGVASWAVTDPSKFRRIAKEAKFQGQRPPEFWVKDGERRGVLFVDEDAVACFQMYRVPVGNNKYDSFVQPPEGEPDLFANVLDLRPQRQFLFRVIDLDGYTDKKGKQVKNVPRFYRVGARQYEQLMLTVSETGIKLNKQIIRVCRTGGGTNTVYTFIPRPGGHTNETRKVLEKFPKWQEHYRPLSQAEQRRIVEKSGKLSDEND